MIIEGASNLLCLCTSSPFTVSSKMFDLKTILYLSELAKVSFNPMSCHIELQPYELSH